MTPNVKALSADSLPESIEAAVKQAKAEHRALILVTGVFDVLHQVHLTFLRQAKALGGFLLVGLESDLRVRQIKGEGRPINTESQRRQQLLDEDIADQVFILPDAFSRPEDHRALILHLRPKYLAVSSHTAHLEAKLQLLSQVGGEVKIVHQHNPAVSTTQLLAQARQAS